MYIDDLNPKYNHNNHGRMGNPSSISKVLFISN